MARQTRLQKAVSKATSKLRKTVNDLAKKGFIIPEYIDRMLNGKTVSSRRLERLNSYDRSKLMSVSKYWDSSTQKVVSGARGQEIMREAAAKKAVETRRRNNTVKQGGAIIDHYMSAIRSLPVSRYFRVKKKWLTADVSEYNDALEMTMVDMLNDAKADGFFDTYIQYLNRVIDEFDSLIESLYIPSMDEESYSEAVNKLLTLITNNSMGDSERQELADAYSTGDGYDI